MPPRLDAGDAWITRNLAVACASKPAALRNTASRMPLRREDQQRVPAEHARREVLAQRADEAPRDFRHRFSPIARRKLEVARGEERIDDRVPRVPKRREAGFCRKIMDMADGLPPDVEHVFSEQV